MKLPFFENKAETIQLKDSEILLILESLATMLASGIPILEALTSISEDSANPKTKFVVSSIIESVNAGKSLSESFGKFPAAFDPVFLSIVRSGEASGNLDKVLLSASESLKNNIQTKSDVKAALFYPVIVLSVLFLVAVLVFGYSLPKVAKVFFALKLKLPGYSASILHLALWFGSYKFYILGFLVFLAFCAYLLLKMEPIRKLVLRLFLKLPIVSKITNLMDLARFTSTSGLLLSAGVPIIDALGIAKDVVISDHIKADIKAVQEDLTAGLSLSKSMKQTPKSFPSLLRRVVGVGEESGNLDKSLTDISLFYNRKFTEIIKNLTVVIEPILIVAIAVIVAFVLISVVLPIYQGIGSINHQ